LRAVRTTITDHETPATPTSDEPCVWFITGAGSRFGRTVTEAAIAAGDVVVAAVPDLRRDQRHSRR